MLNSTLSCMPHWMASFMASAVAVWLSRSTALVLCELELETIIFILNCSHIFLLLHLPSDPFILSWLRCIVVHICSKKTWKTFMTLEQLSVVVLRIFPTISNSEWMSFRMFAKASNVFKPLSCLKSVAVEHLLSFPRSIRWAVRILLFSLWMSALCL